MSTLAQQIQTQLLNSNSVTVVRKVIADDLSIATEARSITIELIECVFEKSVSISLNGGNHFVLKLNDCTFKENVRLSLIGANAPDLSLNGATLEKGFDLACSGKIALDCQNIKWGQEINLEDCKFRKLDFRKAIGGEQATLKANMINITGESSFADSKLGEAEFIDSKFEVDISFDRSIFKSANFINAIFQKDLYLNHTEFGERATFNGSQFHGQVIAPFSNQQSMECVGDFSGCSFTLNAYFDSSNFHKFICIRSVFKQSVSFNNSNYWFVDYIGTHFSNAADFSNTKYKSGSIETFRTIKSELERAGNKVESLYYQSQELNRYDNHLKWSDQKLEKIMLFFNRVSTNHGVNWGRGVLFTFCVSLFFYSFYIVSLPGRSFKWGFTSWNSFWSASNYVGKNYFNFLAIFRDFTFIENSHPNVLSYALDFFGRIFIGYGIYQTIQAFRKYGKS